MDAANMSRREFMGGVAMTSMMAPGFSAAASSLALLKPPVLHRGDLVGLVAPASPVFEPSDIKEAGKALEKLGFRVKPGRHLADKWGYLAGKDQDRAQDVMDMFLDPDVRAIVALRGGYGTPRLLGHLDYGAIRRNAKILIGYSDITSLLLAIHKMAGIVTFHGAVALSTFNDYSTDYFSRTLTQDAPVGWIQEPPASNPTLLPRELKSGTVRGRLVGGNMTLVCSGLGTPYEIDTRDSVLFLEEVGEEPYAIDRMLTQLAQAGKFASCKAVLLDRCAKCQPAEYKPAFYNTLSVEEIIIDRLGELGVPVLYGLSIGHVADKPVLPLGIEVEVDLEKKRFQLLESAVV
jgi:muramoyltetrapeptide carboxypeptidase